MSGLLTTRDPSGKEQIAEIVAMLTSLEKMLQGTESTKRPLPIRPNPKLNLQPQTST
jgi:hypothetical protein